MSAITKHLDTIDKIIDNTITEEDKAYMAGMSVLGDVATKICEGKITIESSGHFGSGRKNVSDRDRDRDLKFLANSVVASLWMSSEKSELVEVLTNRAIGKKDNRIPTITSYNLRCYCCCEQVRFKARKTKIVPTKSCPHPKGFPEYSVYVNVPSGKLVFANDFRDLVKVADGFDVNSTLGCKQTTEAYATAQMFHTFVGNTCPGIYLVNDSKIDLTSREHRDKGKSKKPRGRRKGAICTDLWWFSAMDYDHLRSITTEDQFKDIIDDTHTTVVKVRPGRYRMITRTHRVRSDGRETKDGWRRPEERFATIQRSGNVCRVKEKTQYEEAHEFLLGFENSIKVSRLTYPSISPTRNRILDQMFCTIGNGLNWKDGTLVSVGTDDYAAMKRLQAGAKVTYGWSDQDKRLWPNCEEMGKYFYPMSQEYSKLCNVPDDIKPDWLAGVIETCDAIVKVGVRPKKFEEHDGQQEGDKRNVALAKKAKRELKKRFCV